MIHAVRNLGRPGLASTAISAVDVALWDLEARLLRLPLATLLGAVRDAVPLYGSGGFTSYSGQELQTQLAGWVEQGIRHVKMKVGRQSARDLGDRRAFARISALGARNTAIVSLRRLGLIANLPDSPIRRFADSWLRRGPRDSVAITARVDILESSTRTRWTPRARAYQRLRMPCAVFSFGSYDVTMHRAAVGGANRACGPGAVDALKAGRLTIDQWTKHRAFRFMAPTRRRRHLRDRAARHSRGAGGGSHSAG